MTEHAESPIGSRDEEEQDGRGGECKQALGEGERGKQGRQSERRGYRQEQSGQALFPSPRGRDPTEMAKSTSQRVSCF